LSWYLVIALAAVELWGVRMLAPPRGREPYGEVWRDIWRLAVGFVGAATFAMLWIESMQTPGLHGMRQALAMHFAAAGFATIMLVGLRGVLNVIGFRSREYRRSRGGRQNVELIIIAMAAGFLGALVGYFVRLGWLPREVLLLDLLFISRVIVWASHFMVVVGLAYLVLNAWWIRRSLRKPPPPVNQVLSIPPAATIVTDREE
jgi:hypothetical protein